MTRGLLLLGHGSYRNMRSGDALRLQAERVRARGVFHTVGVGFWNGEPSLRQGLADVSTDEIVVIPMFASAGYYTETVIPRELQLDGPETIRDGRVIRYRPSLGGHPGIADILIERASQADADGATGVVVLGHGTPRNPNSARNILAQVERVRARAEFAEVCAAFIDQEPLIENVWERTVSQELVMVPLFMAEGWHVRETIPADLSMIDGVVIRGERSLRITEPVGTHPGLADLIVDMAG